MACFLVPAGEAVITTVVQKIVERKEKGAVISPKWSQRLGWLNKMLWGGTLMLAIDHLISGEVTFYPPFFTALNSPADTAVMLHEMATVGVIMAAAVTAVWGIMVLITEFKSKIVLARKAQTIS